jgi:putative cell wall-binding protein
MRDLRAANEELLSERRQLMEAIDSLEEQNKISHKNLEEALERVNDLERKVDGKGDELEEIRQKITRVAELFERKEIKQKYSFEVLCDFIYDKAKRLFAKYENVSKDKKVMQEEKNFYFQRKLDQLEQENA